MESFKAIDSNFSGFTKAITKELQEMKDHTFLMDEKIKNKDVEERKFEIQLTEVTKDIQESSSNQIVNNRNQY